MAGKQKKTVMGIENFVRGVHHARRRQVLYLFGAPRPMQNPAGLRGVYARFG
jgi:hypothetical protein